MKIVIGLGVVIVLLVGLVLLLPFLIDLNKYQDQYRPIIEDALNRKIALQDIRLTMWPRFGVRVAGFTVMDDPVFAAGPFASLTSLDVGVKLLPLLRKRVEVEEVTLHDPVITVIKNEDGVMNVSTIGPKGPAPSKPRQPDAPPAQPSGSPLQALALLAVDRVSITGGQLTYRDHSTPKPTEYQVQNLKFLLKSVHLGETPTLHLEATVQPLNLPVELDGSFGPMVETLDLQRFNFTLGLGKIALALTGSAVGGKLNATLSSPLIDTKDLPISLPLTKPVQVTDLHATVKASYPPKAGSPPLELADVTDLGLAVTLGSSVLNVKGTVLSGHAKVSATSPVLNSADVPATLPLKKPVEVKDFHVAAELEDQEARVTTLSFQVFNGQANANATLSLASPAPPFSSKITIQGLQLGPALEALGTDQVNVSGAASADLALHGRGFSMPDITRALEGVGHISVKDGKLEGVNLLQEATALLKAVGVATDSAKVTAFSTIETDVAIKNGIISIQRLLMESHDFQVTGAGTVGFDQTLNLKTNLNLSQALSQKIAGASPVAKLALKDGRLFLPLSITGTAQAPVYGLDSKALMGKVQEQIKEKVKGAVGEVLKGHAKPEELKQKGQDLLKGLFGR